MRMRVLGSNKMLLLIVPTVAVAALGGCTSVPFMQKERTTIITPRMRMSTVQEIGARASNADDVEQQRLCEQLAQQIQTEPDPLVRQEIQNAVAEFSTPLAKKILLAGLQDEDLNVRLTCCFRLAERGDAEAIGSLRHAMLNDEELDVRLAAIDALGNVHSSESIAALGVALKDSDPAVQYASVQALKSVTGQDLGNDVNAWQQYVSGGAVPTEPEISVAERAQQWSPF